MFAAIHIPDFALRAVLRATPQLATEPVALVEEASPKAKVLQLTPTATAHGVSPGMTSTQAMARCPGVHLKACSPAAERAARDIILQCALAASPWLEDTAPGLCTLQLAGPSAPRSPVWLGLIERLQAQHLPARIGLAATPDLALLAAHRAEPFLHVADATAFLGDLPVEALDPSPPLLSILQKWGVRSLRDFIRLGRDPLLRRLGAEAGPLFDRATGRSRRPLRLVQPPEIFEEFMEFEHEVETLEPLLFIVRRFLDQIAGRLEAIHLAVAELHLELNFSRHYADESTTDQPTSTLFRRSFKIPEPTGRVETLFRTLHTHLENFSAPSPIVALRLRATPCRPGRQQFGLFETALRDPNRFFETLSRLTALLGEDRVGTPQALDTHRPDAFILTTPGTRFPPLAKEPPERIGLPLRRARPPLPTRLRPAQALSATGPWHSSGDWWDATPWAREEWDLRLPDGRLCRIFREGGRWFLDGHYD